MHPGQLSISVETVRHLVDNQFPRWRDLNIQCVDGGGTVNAIFRLGDRLSARFPLEPGDAEATRTQVEWEMDAARLLVGRTRFATPEPVALGAPGAEYPLPWSVHSWVSGIPATGEDGGPASLACDLADFIGEVRAIDTAGRKFSGRGRGGDLRSHDDWMDQCFYESSNLLDVPLLQQIWSHLRGLAREEADTMTHGDLIPGNVLTRGGRLVGIIDTGGVGAADPALDLVCAWHLFDEASREVLRSSLGCDDLQWERGKAWAFQQAMGIVWYYAETLPAFSAMGRRTLERIAADKA